MLNEIIVAVLFGAPLGALYGRGVKESFPGGDALPPIGSATARSTTLAHVTYGAALNAVAILAAFLAFELHLWSEEGSMAVGGSAVLLAHALASLQWAPPGRRLAVAGVHAGASLLLVAIVGGLYLLGALMLRAHPLFGR